MQDISYLNKRIYKLRTSNNMTQKQLADKVGVSEATISYYESGKKSPKAKTLEKLGDVLDVTVKYLLFGNDNTEEKYNNVIVIGENIKILYNDVPQEKLEKITSYIKFVLTEGNHGYNNKS